MAKYNKELLEEAESVARSNSTIMVDEEEYEDFHPSLRRNNKREREQDERRQNRRRGFRDF